MESANQVSILTERSFIRVLKSGKEVRRTALGAMTSGNKAEKAAVNEAVMARLIDAHDYRMWLHETIRVFGAAPFKKASHFLVNNGTLFIEETGGSFTPVMGRATKAIAVATATAVIDHMQGKEAKGEKSFYLTGAVRVIENAKAAEAKKAADLALRAEQAQSTSTLTEA